MERPGVGLMQTAYRVLMRRNSVYVAFVLAGAIAGERVVDGTINKLWDHNNKGIFAAGQCGILG